MYIVFPRIERIKYTILVQAVICDQVQEPGSRTPGKSAACFLFTMARTRFHAPLLRIIFTKLSLIDFETLQTRIEHFAL